MKLSHHPLAILSSTLLRGGAWMSYYGGRLRPGIHARRCRAWARSNVGEQLRYDYDLGPGSTVLDIGGFRGDWAAEIHARYGCTVHIFEPAPTFTESLHHRFGRNPKVVVHRFGLGGRTRTESLALLADGSSIFRNGASSVSVEIRAAADFLQEHRVDRVDLAKINIEGGEYELLDHLINSGWIDRFRDIQVQFHEDAYADAHGRMGRIHRKLAEQFSPTYQIPFVWENWRRREETDATARAA